MPQPKFLWYLTIIFLLLAYFNIVTIVRADDQFFGISLDCFDSCKDKTIDSSKDIMLVLTIKNNLDYWVSIGDENNINTQYLFSMNVENINLQDTNYLQNGKRVESHNDFLGKRFFIKPKTELQVYIPFDTYNQFGKDNRLGDWKIIPELQINNIYSVYFYNNPFESKSTPLYSNGQSFTISSPVIGNILEFKAIKPEIQIQGDNSSMIPSQEEKSNAIPTGFVVSIITVILGAILTPYFGYRYFTKRGKKKR